MSKIEFFFKYKVPKNIVVICKISLYAHIDFFAILQHCLVGVIILIKY